VARGLRLVETPDRGGHGGLVEELGILVGLDCTVNPLARCPSFAAVGGLDLDGQVAAYADPSRRAVLVDELRAATSERSLRTTYVLGDPPNYEPGQADRTVPRAITVPPIQSQMISGWTTTRSRTSSLPSSGRAWSAR